MFKFFKSLFFPKKKQVESEPEVRVDIVNGKISIISDRKLSDEEVKRIAKKALLEYTQGGEEC